MEQFDLVIVGGGISGLSLAQMVASQPNNPRVAVLEKASHPGGAIQSVRLDNNFWMELGTHTAYNSYGGMISMMEARGVMDKLLARNKVPWLFWENAKTRTVTSKLHWLELALSLPRGFFTNKDGLTVEQYFTRLLGRKNFQEVLGPMVGAVTSQDASAFPAEMLFKKRPRRKDIRRSYTLEGGLQTATDAMATSPGVTFVPNCEVIEIREIKGEVEIKTNGATYRASTFGLATQPLAGAALMQKTFPAVAEPLAKMGHTQAETVGVVVNKSDTPLPVLAGLVGGDRSFYSVVSRDTVDHPNLRGFAFHFRTGLDDAGKDERIAAVTGVPRNQWAHRMTKSNPLPAPVVGHQALVATLDKSLTGTRLLVTGNYFSGLALEDCVARSASEAERFKLMGEK